MAGAPSRLTSLTLQQQQNAVLIASLVGYSAGVAVGTRSLTPMSASLGSSTPPEGAAIDDGTRESSYHALSYPEHALRQGNRI